MSTNNININSIGVIPSPQEIKSLFPLNDSLVENITKTRDDIKKVL